MKPNARELHWFWTANAGHPYGWYAFKDRFLKRFATLIGYCLQEIERECWTCDGSGLYTTDETCRKCGGDGIYRRDENWLECWQLGDVIYHRPIDPLPHWQRKGVTMLPTIYGRIQHRRKTPHPLSPLWPDIEEEVSHKSAQRAFLRLLLRFEPMNFYWHVVSLIKAGITQRQASIRFKLIRLRNKLDLFPTVPDDVPF